MRRIHEFEIRNLLRMACDAMDRSYTPGNGAGAGACLKGISGAYYMGCRIEGESGEHFCCAEGAAICRGVYEGERRFDALAIVSSQEEARFPCAACIRALMEFDDGKLPVICSDRSGKYRIYELDELRRKSSMQEER